MSNRRHPPLTRFRKDVVARSADEAQVATAYVLFLSLHILPVRCFELYVIRKQNKITDSQTVERLMNKPERSGVIPLCIN